MSIQLERCKEIANLLEKDVNWQSLMEMKLNFTTKYINVITDQKINDVEDLLLDAVKEYGGLAELLYIWFESENPNLRISPDDYLVDLAISNVMCAVALDRVAYKLSTAEPIKSNRTAGIEFKIEALRIHIDKASGRDRGFAEFKFKSPKKDNSYTYAWFYCKLDGLDYRHGAKYLNRGLDVSYNMGWTGTSLKGSSYSKVTELNCNYFTDILANARGY